MSTPFHKRKVFGIGGDRPISDGLEDAARWLKRKRNKIYISNILVDNTDYYPVVVVYYHKKVKE